MTQMLLKPIKIMHWKTREVTVTQKWCFKAQRMASNISAAEYCYQLPAVSTGCLLLVLWCWCFILCKLSFCLLYIWWLRYYKAMPFGCHLLTWNPHLQIVLEFYSKILQKHMSLKVFLVASFLFILIISSNQHYLSE